MSLRNWKNFHSPYDPLSTFTRSEPFPTEEMKATYLGDKPKKKGAKLYFEALLHRKPRPRGEAR